MTLMPKASKRARGPSGMKVWCPRQDSWGHQFIVAQLSGQLAENTMLSSLSLVCRLSSVLSSCTLVLYRICVCESGDARVQ